MEHLRKSGTWPKHAPEDGDAPVAVRGPGLQKVRALTRSERYARAGALDELLGARWGANTELALRMGEDESVVRDWRKGDRPLWDETLVRMGALGREVLARAASRRAA